MTLFRSRFVRLPLLAAVALGSAATPALADPFSPNDELFPAQWGLNNTGEDILNADYIWQSATADADIDAPEAWGSTPAIGAGQVVAVVDGKINIAHPDLAGQFWTPPSESSSEFCIRDILIVDTSEVPCNQPRQYSDHGTEVASTVAAKRNNGIGLAGVAPGAKIMAIAAVESPNSIPKAFRYAVEHGATVVNYSGAVYASSEIEQLRQTILSAPQVTFVVTAGNTPEDRGAHPRYPGSFAMPNVITVGATTTTDRMWDSSAYGTPVALSAPGDASVVADRTGDYKVVAGTSYAAPVVAGAAALIKSQYPAHTGLQIRQRLIDTSDYKPTASKPTFSNGRLNLNRAVNDGGTVSLESGRLRFLAKPGTASTVTISNVTVGGQPFVRVADSSSPLAVGTGSGTAVPGGVPANAVCVTESTSAVRCPAASVTSLLVETLDGEDSLTNRSSLPSTLDAGPGEDILSGGLGNDKFVGGTGVDTVDYSDRTDQLSVTLGGYGGRKDGAETDLVGSDIESVYGGSANDSLFGTAANETFFGGGGNDLIRPADGNDFVDGEGGDDTIYASGGADAMAGGAGIDTVTYQGRTAPVTVTVGAGINNDGASGEGDDVRSTVERVTGGEANDILTGNSAANTIAGGSGNDTIDPGTGVDVVSGNAGADLIKVRDTSADSVTCGTETDVVQRDALDTAASDCESVTVG